MRTVYVDRRHAALDAESGALVIRVPGERPATLPLAAVERLVVRGTATLGAGLLAALWRQDAGLLLLSGRRGEPTARLLGRPHADAALRLAQYALQADRPRRAAIARRLVAAKVAAQRRTLERALVTAANRRQPLLRGIAALDHVRAELARGDADLGRLTGLEGAAAAGYFEAFAALFPPAFGFVARNRRPPRDPVNALLSLGYTLLQFEAARQCQITGLDPQLGVLHEPAYGRDSLACDLVEPLRWHVDELVLALVRGGELRREHFSQDGAGGCLMGKAGRERFYAAWEEHGAAVGRLLRRMCRQLIADIRADGLTP